MVVITGVSGSGKSSLAFDTIYAEGQRRYVESLSAYARQFLSVMEKPDVDSIEGLSPAISIEQKSTSHNPRSTVGTVTEIHDYLRLLFARVGEPYCPKHGNSLAAQTVSQMVDAVLALPPGDRCMLLAPVANSRKGNHANTLQQLRAEGFVRAMIDGQVLELDGLDVLAPRSKHDIAAVVDRFSIRPEISQRLAESFETALRLGGGVAQVCTVTENGRQEKSILFSALFACPHCDYSVPELEPRLFSFNNPAGACAKCSGLGHIRFIDPERIVHDGSLSLQDGAIRGWDSGSVYYMNVFRSLAKHYDFDLDKPFKRLPVAVRKAILYGSGQERIRFSYRGGRGRTVVRTHAFEGIISNMERRYRETDSPAVREELACYLSEQACPECSGSRLCEAARHIKVGDYHMQDLMQLPIDEISELFENIKLPGNRAEIAARILKEVKNRLRFLIDVGLDYLSLGRGADTLSGGEAQRIRLASQIGAGLVGVMYVLDEPSIGLHQRDNKRLLDSLMRLRDLGNTVLVVEHDSEAIASADYVIDIGPGAGVHGGKVVAYGSVKQVCAVPESLTGQYLSGKRSIKIPKERMQAQADKTVRLCAASGNNLKKINVDFPLGLFICVTGVSGSGKSTLINNTLYRMIAERLHRSPMEAAPCKSVSGLEMLDKVVKIDQAPIGRTPRSNPATYTGLFTPVRDLFAALPESRARGYKPGRFSFNVRGGRCEACSGDGVIRVEMHFLPDMHVPCDSCHGKRYNRETLDLRYKGCNIHQVLEMTVAEAADFFHAIPSINAKLDTLRRVGLDYVKLGQMATTLSGGEAQRIKLSRELSRRDTGNTMYVLDEPTTGLHFHDVGCLLQVLQELRDRGNTIVVIEHNLDVIKTADWVIDLGPEGGAHGGEVVATGTPEQIAACDQSYTGKFLQQMVGIKPVGSPPRRKK